MTQRKVSSRDDGKSRCAAGTLTYRRLAAGRLSRKSFPLARVRRRDLSRNKVEEANKRLRGTQHPI